MSTFYKLSVKEIKRETKHSVSIVFSVPDDLQNEFQFIPGQYINIQTNLKGENIRRAYSICSSLKSKELRIGVKEVKKGSFSVYANKKLKVGDVLDVSPPEGKFALPIDETKKHNYIAFAAGSGITPILSMIKSVLETEKNSQFILVYGNKSVNETMFKDEIDELELSNRFKVHYIFSQKVSDAGYYGRINSDLLKEILETKYKDIAFDNYFLCGPEEMIELIKKNLETKGIQRDLIKYELFTTTSSSATQTENDLSGKSLITVILDDEETSFEMEKDDVILNAALLEGLDAPYSCQGGICSSCLAKVTEGEVVMDNNSILDEDELKDGLILTCQSHPVTAKVKIDYDDI